MRRIYITLLLVGICCLIGKAQNLPPDTIFNRTAKQAMLFPTEKVYLHTDKSSYVAGENIWVRAHVVDGITHVPSRKSRYVYVVLQNPFLERVKEIRLRADEDGFIHGNIPLPENLAKGEYSLCAYTKYMENIGNEYFFKKRILINNIMGNSIRLETSLKGRNLNFQFVNPVTEEIKKIKHCAATVTSGHIDVLHRDSGYYIKFHESKEKVVLIQAGNYKEFVNVDIKREYDVSFLPEGGNLVAGTFNRVAFKCINDLGQGENVAGTLRDENDSILLSFKSIHRGMGVFSFMPRKGKIYTAVCENDNGIQKRFQLPEITENYGIQVNEVRGKFFVKVLAGVETTKTDSLYILAHQRGWPVMLHRYTLGNEVYAFNAEEFIQGTASFLLLNSHGRILNERMVFVNKAQNLEGILTPDKPEYNKREKVHISLDVKELSGKVWNGDCSIAVTNNHDIMPDSCTNILSCLLLESDLKGYVEDPAWYFRSGNGYIRNRALDVLMMTQGWKKYNLEQGWKNAFKFPAHQYEQSMSVKGKVTTRVTRKSIVGARVQMMLPLGGDKYEQTTGPEGTFHFNGFEYPDSTQYWVSAYSKKGKDNVVLILDTVVQPILSKTLPPFKAMIDKIKQQEPSSDYLSKVDLKIMNEKGIRHLFLDEVIVTAPKNKPKTIFENVIGCKSIKEERIKGSGVNDLFVLIQQNFPGVNYRENQYGDFEFLIRGDIARVVIDGQICYDSKAVNILKFMNKNDIQQIDVIKPPWSGLYDPRYGSGVIAITTKAGDRGNAEWDPTNLQTIMPLGYQTPVEFYSPRYELTTNKGKETPDLRTTIHWQPCLKVKNGKANVEFYTADDQVDYSIVIEGIGQDGSLLRVEKVLKN